MHEMDVEDEEIVQGEYFNLQCILKYNRLVSELDFWHEGNSEGTTLQAELESKEGGE